MVSEVTSGWDDPVEEVNVLRLVEELIARVRVDDPAKGRWDVSDDAVTAWTDAGSLALGVALDVDGKWLKTPAGCVVRRTMSTSISRS